MQDTIKVKCGYCDKEFDKYVKHYKRSERLGHLHYCSRKCSQLAQNKGEMRKCAWCCTEIYVSESRRKRSKSGKYFCSRSCSNSHRNTLYVGSKHPNYRGAEYREKALSAYGAKCTRCGYDKCKAAIEVHHKDHNRDNNNLCNLEVLCRNCHAEEHHGG